MSSVVAVSIGSAIRERPMQADMQVDAPGSFKMRNCAA
jgi:hypothetical protein